MSTNIREVRGILTKLQETFQCVICLDLLTEPVSTACNHQFCRACIGRIAARRNAVCPLCKQSLSKRGLNSNEHLSQIVDGVRFLVEAATQDSASICTPPLRLSSQRISNTPAIEQFRCMYPTPVKAVKRRQRELATSGESTAESDDETTLSPLAASHSRQPVAQRHQRKASAPAAATITPELAGVQVRAHTGPLPLARAGRGVSKSADTSRRTARRRPTAASVIPRPGNENQDPLEFPVDDSPDFGSSVVAPLRSRSRSSRSLSLRSETPSTASEVATSRGTEREALQPLAVNSTVSQGSAGKLKKDQLPSNCEYCGKTVSSRGWTRHLTSCPVLLAMQASALDADDTPSSNTRRTGRTRSSRRQDDLLGSSPGLAAWGEQHPRANSASLGTSPVPCQSNSTEQQCGDASGALETMTNATGASLADASQSCLAVNVCSTTDPSVGDKPPDTLGVEKMADSAVGSRVEEAAMQASSDISGQDPQPPTVVSSAQQASSLITTDGNSPGRCITSAVFCSQTVSATAPVGETGSVPFSPPGFFSSGLTRQTPSPNTSGIQRALQHTVSSSDSSRATSQGPQATPKSSRSRRSRTRVPPRPSGGTSVQSGGSVPEPVTSAPAEEQKSMSAFDLCAVCGTSTAECGDCFTCTQSTNIPSVSRGIFQDPSDSPDSADSAHRCDSVNGCEVTSPMCVSGNASKTPISNVDLPNKPPADDACVLDQHTTASTCTASPSANPQITSDLAGANIEMPDIANVVETSGLSSSSLDCPAEAAAAGTAPTTDLSMSDLADDHVEIPSGSDAGETGLSSSLLERVCSSSSILRDTSSNSAHQAQEVTTMQPLSDASLSEVRPGGGEARQTMLNATDSTSVAVDSSDHHHHLSTVMESSPRTSQATSSASGVQREAQALSEIFLLAGSAPQDNRMGFACGVTAGLVTKADTSSLPGSHDGASNSPPAGKPTSLSQGTMKDQDAGSCLSVSEEQTVMEVLSASGDGTCYTNLDPPASAAGPCTGTDRGSQRASKAPSTDEPSTDCYGSQPAQLDGHEPPTLDTGTCTELTDNIIEGTEAVDDLIGMDFDVVRGTSHAPLAHLAPGVSPALPPLVEEVGAAGQSSFTQTSETCADSVSNAHETLVVNPSTSLGDQCMQVEEQHDGGSCTEEEEEEEEDDVIPPTPPACMPALPDTTAKEQPVGGGGSVAPSLRRTLTSSDSISTQDVSRMQNELANMRGELDYLNGFLGSETSGTDNTLQTTAGISTEGSSSLTDTSVNGRPSISRPILSGGRHPTRLAKDQATQLEGSIAVLDNDTGLSLSCLEQAVDPLPATKRTSVCDPPSSQHATVPERCGSPPGDDADRTLTSELVDPGLSPSCLTLATMATPVASNSTADIHNLSASCLEQATMSMPAIAVPSSSNRVLSTSDLGDAGNNGLNARLQTPSGRHGTSSPCSQVSGRSKVQEITNSCLEKCLDPSFQESRVPPSGNQALQPASKSVLSCPSRGLNHSESLDPNDILAADSQPALSEAVKRRSPPESDDEDDVIGVRKKRRESFRAPVIAEDEEDEEDDVPLSAVLNITPPPEDSDDDGLQSLPSVFGKPTPSRSLLPATPVVCIPSHPIVIDDDDDQKREAVLHTVVAGEHVKESTVSLVEDSTSSTMIPGSGQAAGATDSQSLTASLCEAAVEQFAMLTPTPPPADLGEFPTHLLRYSQPAGRKNHAAVRESALPSACNADQALAKQTPSLDSIESSLPSVLPVTTRKAIRRARSPVSVSTDQGSHSAAQQSTGMTKDSAPAHQASPVTNFPMRSPGRQSSQSLYKLLGSRHQAKSTTTEADSSGSRGHGGAAKADMPFSPSGKAVRRMQSSDSTVDGSETQDTSRNPPSAVGKVRIAATPPCATTSMNTTVTGDATTHSTATGHVTSAANVARPLKSPPVNAPTRTTAAVERDPDYDLGFTASGRLAESAYAGKEISIVLSTPPAALVSRIQVLKKQHGIRLAHTLSGASTHVVFNSDHTRVVQQSVKYFQALAARTWMVTVSWLEECYKTGKIVNEELHEVIGDRQGFMGAPRKARFARRFDEPLLFQEFAVYLSGQFYVIGKDILAQILQIGGALILESASSECPKEKTLVVLFDPDAGEPNVPADFGYVTILSAQWALDSLASYKLLPMADFAPCIDTDLGAADGLADIYGN